MCGRITLHEAERALGRILPPEEWQMLLQIPPGLWNVAPSAVVPVVVAGEKPQARMMKWGMAAGRAGPRPFTPSETARRWTGFRDAVRRHRCLIPANGFFEWEKRDRERQPWLFARKDGEPIAIAGIYDEASGWCLLTCAANAVVTPIHDRMPVIVPEEGFSTWLAPRELDDGEYRSICRPFPDELMRADRVSPLVNNARNDVPECVVPLADLPAATPRPGAQGELAF